MQLPLDLITSLRDAPGFDERKFLAVHQLRESITSVRFNPVKKSNALQDYVDQKVPWSTHGFYLSSRPFFTFDPLLHAGAYYVQEASSMFLEQAIRQTTPLNDEIKVLDLCAAPGGKSTLVQSMLNESSLLVSNEVIRARVNVLAENLTKWGYPNIVVTNNDAKDFQRLPGYFDLMIVDAPCSGSGLFRREVEAVKEWSLANVELCSQRQQRIIADALPALKDNGILIYSTCSYSVDEDEAISDWLVQDQNMEPISLSVDPSWNIVESGSTKTQARGYRFYPDKLKGEGFYLACFRKKADESYKVQRGEKLMLPSKTETQIISGFLAKPEEMFLWKLSDRLLSIPLQFQEDIKLLISRMYIRKAGISIGKIAGKDLVPDHELALSVIASKEIPSISLKNEIALQYLRREEVKVETELKGWVLAEYEGIPLGWMKVLANRVNNYYPREWRILKGSTN
jgi:16S rRNA C967 or C1407 C5-methylase (RsmB/RsmF family)/NOL1/NOP2/fmu family ribosome biogenesis protein